MDLRLVIVFAPLLIAAGWAAYRILPVALSQLQQLLAKA